MHLAPAAIYGYLTRWQAREAHKLRTMFAGQILPLHAVVSASDTVTVCLRCQPDCMLSAQVRTFHGPYASTRHLSPERTRKHPAVVLQCSTEHSSVLCSNAAAAASGACLAAGSGHSDRLCATACVYNHNQGARVREATRQPRVHDRAVAAAAGALLPYMLCHAKQV